MRKKILFVCTGNTCRSSMAEALFRNMLADQLGETAGEYLISSAGLAATPGEGASAHAVTVLSAQGISLAEHRASLLSPEQVAGADLVLTMTASHKRRVQEMVPEARRKVFTLKEFIREQEEVELVREMISDMLEDMHDQQDQYIRQNQARIDLLRKRRDELLNELAGVEQELQRLEDIFLDLLLRDRSQLQELEKKVADVDILDPFGGTLEIYQACAGEIKTALEKLLDKLQAEDR